MSVSQIVEIVNDFSFFFFLHWGNTQRVDENDFFKSDAILLPLLLPSYEFFLFALENENKHF